MDGKNLVKYLQQSVSATTIISSSKQDKTFNLYGKPYRLVAWDEVEYRKGLKGALKIFQNNCPTLTEESFSNAVAKVCVSMSTCEEAADALIDHLAGLIKKRTTCIPIQGIDMRVPSMDLGFGVLYRRDEGLLPELLKDGTARFSSQHDINALDSSHCYLEVESVTDDREAITRALELAEYLCALLSLHVGSSSYRAWKRSSNWYDKDYGDFFPRRRKVSIWGSESGDSTVYYQYNDTESPFHNFPYELNFRLLNPGLDGYQAICDPLSMLQPEEPVTTYHLVDESVRKIIVEEYRPLLQSYLKKTSVEKSVAQSIYWFGKAVNADTNEQQFLFFAISLECLLTGKEVQTFMTSMGSITQKISERAAFIFSELPAERLGIEKEIKLLYGIRSKIAHAGERADNQEVLRIETLTRALILKVSNHEFTTFEEITEWVKMKQYGFPD